MATNAFSRYTAAMPAEEDWTAGPAKWIAVGLLGAAAIAGMTWAVAQKFAHAPNGTVITAAPAFQPMAAQPAPVQPAAVLPVNPQEARVSSPQATRLASNSMEFDASAPEVNFVSPEEESAVKVPSEAIPAATTPPSPPAPAPPSSGPLTLTRIINVNTAPAAELELLPGIGPALAGRIVEYRETHGPFRTTDDLTEVRGIGPKTLERLRPRIRVH